MEMYHLSSFEYSYRWFSHVWLPEGNHRSPAIWHASNACFIPTYGSNWQPPPITSRAAHRRWWTAPRKRRNRPKAPEPLCTIRDSPCGGSPWLLFKHLWGSWVRLGQGSVSPRKHLASWGFQNHQTPIQDMPNLHRGGRSVIIATKISGS